MKKNINIELDSELWKSVKLEAVRREMTVQKFVTEALRNWLDGVTRDGVMDRVDMGIASPQRNRKGKSGKGT